MKTRIFMVVAVLFMGAATVNAKDLRTVIFKVAQMVCSNCENKVKENIRCEKGLKSLSTDLDAKTVTVTYDADKTSAEDLKASFKKFNYEAEIVSDKAYTSSKSSSKASKKSSSKDAQSCCSKDSESKSSSTDGQSCCSKDDKSAKDSKTTSKDCKNGDKK